jgi:antitoxin component YwqK of YwqJK toxin-antitoxin module
MIKTLIVLIVLKISFTHAQTFNDSLSRLENDETKVFYTNGNLKEIKSFSNGKITAYKKYSISGQIQIIEKYNYDESSKYFEWFYDNGILQKFGQYIDNKRAGEWKSFFENAHIKEIVSYKDDLPTGIYKRWHNRYGHLDTILETDPFLYEIGLYLNGKKTGDWRIFYMNGQLDSLLKYDFDNIISYEIYSKDGKLKEVMPLTGQIIYYNENGKLNFVKSDGVNIEKGEWKFYYKNGQIAEMGNLINSLKTGEWKYYYDNEKPRLIINYRKGIKHGYAQSFFEKGQLKTLGKYKHQKLSGEYKEFYVNGQQKLLESYKKNILHGLYSKYFENGHLSENGIYKNGLKVGEWKSFYENGQLEEVVNYISGYKHGENKTYYINNQLENKGYYYENRKKGEWISYYKSGKLYSIENYINEDILGEFKGFYENGQLEKTHIYNTFGNDQIKTFYKNGQLERIENYKYNLKHGEMKEFYENGNLKQIGQYNNGKKIGEWKTFNENGLLSSFDNPINYTEKNNYSKEKMEIENYDIVPIIEGCEEQKTNEDKLNCLNKKILNYIQKTIDQTVFELEENSFSSVGVEILVQENGKITTKVFNSSSKSIEKEIIRIFEKTPNIKPALKNESAVSSMFTFMFTNERGRLKMKIINR